MQTEDTGELLPSTYAAGMHVRWVRFAVFSLAMARARKVQDGILGGRGEAV